MFFLNNLTIYNLNMFSMPFYLFILTALNFISHFTLKFYISMDFVESADPPKKYLDLDDWQGYVSTRIII